MTTWKLIPRSDLENFFFSFFLPSQRSCVTEVASSRSRYPDVPFPPTCSSQLKNTLNSLSSKKGSIGHVTWLMARRVKKGKRERQREMDCVTRPAENTPKGHGSTSLRLAAIHQIFGFNGLIPSLHEYRSLAEDRLGYFPPRARFIIKRTRDRKRILGSVLREFEFPKIEESRIGWK